MAADSIKNVVGSVRSLYSKGVSSRASRLRVRQVYAKLLSVRASVLEKLTMTGKMISETNYDVFECVEIIPAPKFECNCYLPHGCVLHRTKHKLPKLLSGMSDEEILYVTTLDGNIRFSKSNWKKAKNRQGNRFTANKPYYFIRNDYMYLTVPDPELSVITFAALTFDPIEAQIFPRYLDAAPKLWNFPDLDFTMDPRYLEEVKRLTNLELVQLYPQMRDDVTANAADTEIPNTK